MSDEQIKQAVRDAVVEALRGQNLIDGPTHLLHHRMLEEQILMSRHVKKGVLSLIVGGIGTLIVWGMWAWTHGGKP